MSTPDETPAPLPPEREDAVRRLLAASGDDTALPPAVAERLDARLADLVAERGERDVRDPEAPPATVVPLPHRRRRVLAALALAAAVAVVAGIGVPLLHDDSNRTTDTSASSEAAPARPTEAGSGAVAGGTNRTQSLGNDAQAPMAGTAKKMDGASLSALRRSPAGTTYRLDPHRLRPGLLRLRGALGHHAAYSPTPLRAQRDFTCRRAAFGKGVLVGVRYAGSPAVVAFRAPVGTNQVAEVLQCGTGQVLRSVTLPAR